jgi:hypothetical protein
MNIASQLRREQRHDQMEAEADHDEDNEVPYKVQRVCSKEEWGRRNCSHKVKRKLVVRKRKRN